MKKISLLAVSLLFAGTSLLAQLPFVALPPCSTFENPSPAGNWVTTACVAQYVNTNPLDGSQCVTLYDGSGGSWYTNTTDYNNLGRNNLGRCLCFDYFLIDDGDPGTVNFNPTIYLSDGLHSIAFVVNTTVTEGSGWIHVCAPIQHCSGSTLPSNGDGSWTMDVTTMTCTDFNNVMDNVTSVGFPTDINSCPCEVMSIDNVCVRDCNSCHTDFRLQTNINTETGQVDGTVLLNTTDPGVTYKVDWGDGHITSPYVSHLYAGPGNYIVCVSEYDDRGRLICSTCVPFCFGKPTHRYTDAGVGGVDDGGEVSRRVATAVPMQRSMQDKEFTNEGGFLIYPNPTKDYAEIVMPKSKDKVTIRVIDLFGKVVYETDLKAGDNNKVRVNTEKFNEGMYTVEIISGGKVNTQKISVVK